MWIVMTGSYSGQFGIFVKGNKYDLPKSTLDCLPKDSFQKCPAPWDTQKEPQTETKPQAETELQTEIEPEEPASPPLEDIAEADVSKPKTKQDKSEAEGKMQGKKPNNQKGKKSSRKSKESPKDKQMRPEKLGSNYKTK